MKGVLILILVVAIVISRIAKKNKVKQSPVDSVYVCDVCNEHDCVCRAVDNDS